MISSFEIFDDFWLTNPELKILLKEDAHIPSKIMWALLLYIHPKSKFFNESPSTRLKLIQQDYLQDPSFSLSDYSQTLDRIKSLILTKAERSLALWEQKLSERDALIAEIPYTLENFEVVDKLVTNSQKLWDQYFKIQDALSKESETKVEGDIEESLTEKGLI